MNQPINQPTNQPEPVATLTEMLRKAIGAERAWIVAYLRAEAKAIAKTAVSESMIGAVRVEAEARHLDNMAGAIERGEHLRIRE